MIPERLEFGLLGEHLGHSFSPAIHRRLADYDYRLVELSPEEVGPFLTAGHFRGLNVTIPYKKAVIPYCAQLSPAARRIGSVNTIVRRPDGSLYGDNTDYDGFLYLLRSAGAEVAGKKALVLGTGGASLTVHTALADLGVREAVSISRSGPNNYQNLDLHADADLIVNATPVGMYPNTGVAPLDVGRFPRCRGVFDLIYNPARTQLLLDGAKQGMRWANGLGMLVAQARAAAERFLDRPIPEERVAEITAEMERETLNLMLIGMPGCGKSTIGQELARRLGRPLADVDQKIEETAGCSIPEIFAREGEEGFRTREHAALCELSKGSGQIIACGGGIVTRRENYDPMRQNSTIIALNRDLSLLPTSGRPVSQANSLESLYRQRAPLYRELADLTVDNSGTPEETASEIIRRLNL